VTPAIRRWQTYNSNNNHVFCSEASPGLKKWDGHRLAGADLVVHFGGSFYGERGSASLYGGLGAKPPVGSRGKASGGGSGGEAP